MKERKETEAKLRQQLQEEVDKIQSELAEQQRKAEIDFERKKAEVARQKEAMEKKQQEEMGELDKAEKARILDNFEKEHQAALDALDQERRNTKAKLAERLNRRRSMQKAAPPPVAAPERDPSEGLLRSSKAVIGTDSGPPTGGSHGHHGERFSTKASLLNLESNPAFANSMQLIESKLERIERVITAMEKNKAAAGGAFPTTSLPPVPEIPVYQDTDEPAPGEALEIVPDGEIQMQEMARLDFGRRLAAMIGLKSLTIKPALSLPPSTASNNAFANSYNYSQADDTLLVHHNRLASSGDFGLVTIHALSHIKVNPSDLSNDADPLFIAEFYKNLKILSQDLYKKSATTQSAPFAANLAPKVGGPTASYEQQRANAVKRLRASFTQRGGHNEIANAAAAAMAAIGGDGTPVTPLSPTPFSAVSVPATPVPADTAGAANSAFQTHPADYFTSESLHERMKLYAQQGGIPMDYLDRYAASKGNNAP